MCPHCFGSGWVWVATWVQHDTTASAPPKDAPVQELPCLTCNPYAVRRVIPRHVPAQPTTER